MYCNVIKHADKLQEKKKFFTSMMFLLLIQVYFSSTKKDNSSFSLSTGEIDYSLVVISPIQSYLNIRN